MAGDLGFHEEKGGGLSEQEVWGGTQAGRVSVACRWGGQFFLGDRQITHLICVRLKHLLYDLLGGVLGLVPVVFFLTKKRPKHPLKKSHGKCFRRTQIR